MLKIIGGVAAVTIALMAGLWAAGLFHAGPSRGPQLADPPPLKPMTRTSTLLAPVAISLGAIRDAVERSAPRDLSGKQDANLLAGLLSNPDIGWTVSRGAFTTAGRQDGLTISTPLTGALRVTGRVAAAAGNLGGALTGMLSPDLGKQVQALTGRTLDQRTDIRGSVIVQARPLLRQNWRLDPNLTGQVTLAEASTTILGLRLNVANEVRPVLERNVQEQIAAIEARIARDPVIEQAARREWDKMCRSFSLKAASPDIPELWLEVKPTRAIAVQPRIDAQNVTLMLGVQAETRIVPNATRPSCPFPATLEIIAPASEARISVAVPIDLPFREMNRLVEQRLKGRTFPEEKDSSVQVTVKGATLAASGDRLLITLSVDAREKSFIGFAADATVHVWGRPDLDREKQVLTFTDIELDVESEAAFGLLGTAARAAIPYLRDAIAENAVIDLKPLAANARASIEAALAGFRLDAPGVRVDTAVTEVRLAGVEFDKQTLRVIAEADGNVRATLTALPGF